MNAVWLARPGGIGILAGLGPLAFVVDRLIAPLLLVALTIATAQGARDRRARWRRSGAAREAGGLLSASATALWLCLLLTDRLDGREIIGIGPWGAVVLFLATGPLLFGVAAMLAVAALSLRWISVAPGEPALPPPGRRHGAAA